MKNYLFKIEIEVKGLCTVTDFAIIPANNKEAAVRHARWLALDWYGMPEYMNASSNDWIVEEEHADAAICADPEFLGAITKSQQEFLLKNCMATEFNWMDVTDDAIMVYLREATENGLQLDSGMLATLFGEALAARAILELT